jgi:hypothetical protein
MVYKILIPIFKVLTKKKNSTHLLDKCTGYPKNKQARRI